MVPLIDVDGVLQRRPHSTSIPGEPIEVYDEESGIPLIMPFEPDALAAIAALVVECRSIVDSEIDFVVHNLGEARRLRFNL